VFIPGADEPGALGGVDERQHARFQEFPIGRHLADQVF
jgi:hypothetical protein